MKELQDKIREIAQQLLSQKEVSVVLGYKRGTFPFKSMPYFIEEEKEAENLVFNSFCHHNLSRYIPQEKGRKIGIVALGCTARSIAILLQEKQVEREDLYIIGVSCPGMIDPLKLEEKANLREVEEIEEEGEEIRLEPQGIRIKREEVLFDSCQLCPYPTPVLYDVLIGEERKGSFGFPDVEEMEKLSPEERALFFNERFDLCLRCFACRLSCPSCYCHECFAEATNPRFVSHQVEMEENRLFHLNRTMHLVGRCVSCGECARVCPVRIPLLRLHRKMEKEAYEMFNYVAGIDPAQPPLLATFTPNDPDPEER